MFELGNVDQDKKTTSKEKVRPISVRNWGLAPEATPFVGIMNTPAKQTNHVEERATPAVGIAMIFNPDQKTSFLNGGDGHCLYFVVIFEMVRVGLFWLRLLRFW